MHDSFGTCYAVYAEDSLTCQNVHCVYMELNENDCEKAYKEAQTHI